MKNNSIINKSKLGFKEQLELMKKRISKLFTKSNNYQSKSEKDIINKLDELLSSSKNAIDALNQLDEISKKCVDNKDFANCVSLKVFVSKKINEMFDVLELFTKDFEAVKYRISNAEEFYIIDWKYDKWWSGYCMIYRLKLEADEFLDDENYSSQKSKKGLVNLRLEIDYCISKLTDLRKMIEMDYHTRLGIYKDRQLSTN